MQLLIRSYLPVAGRFPAFRYIFFTSVLDTPREKSAALKLTVKKVKNINSYSNDFNLGCTCLPISGNSIKGFVFVGEHFA